MKRIALAAAPLILAALTLSPSAAADHGHNCVWTGGAWVGQGPCPGMPGYDDPHGEPTPEPTATSTPTSEPTVTTPAPTTPPRLTPTNKPTMRPTPTSTPTSTATPTSTRTPGCLTSYGNTWCTGATPSTSTTTPAAVVTGPVIDTDIPLYAPAVFPARILR